MKKVRLRKKKKVKQKRVEKEGSSRETQMPRHGKIRERDRDGLLIGWTQVTQNIRRVLAAKSAGMMT